MYPDLSHFVKHELNEFQRSGKSHVDTLYKLEIMNVGYVHAQRKLQGGRCWHRDRVAIVQGFRKIMSHVFASVEKVHKYKKRN